MVNLWKHYVGENVVCVLRVRCGVLCIYVIPVRATLSVLVQFVAWPVSQCM